VGAGRTTHPIQAKGRVCPDKTNEFILKKGGGHNGYYENPSQEEIRALHKQYFGKRIKVFSMVEEPNPVPYGAPRAVAGASTPWGNYW
jgi:hypothetical protein